MRKAYIFISIVSLIIAIFINGYIPSYDSKVAYYAKYIEYPITVISKDNTSKTVTFYFKDPMPEVDKTIPVSNKIFNALQPKMVVNAYDYYPAELLVKYDKDSLFWYTRTKETLYAKERSLIFQWIFFIGFIMFLIGGIIVGDIP